MKKLILLAMSIAMLAAPALALAEEPAIWTMEGQELEGESEAMIPFRGNMRYSTGLGSVECEVHATMTLDEKSTGHIQTFTVTDNTCTLSGIVGAVCTLKESTPQNLPWVVHAVRNGPVSSIKMTGVHLVFDTEGFFCTSTIEAVGDLQAYPNSTTAMTSVALSGTAETNGFGSAAVEGEFQIEEEAEGTYGIE